MHVLRNEFLSMSLRLAAIIVVSLTAGCSTLTMPVFNPVGIVAETSEQLLLLSMAVMALIIVPVIIATLWIAWRYRANGGQGQYEPELTNSELIHKVTLYIPLLTIAFLGYVTWVYTHQLDPYRPLGADTQPYEVQAVSLDYKWLFIYPKQGIATVNRLVIPKDTQISFRVTSQSVMNSFFIPQLGSQIYSMAMMETKLHLIANEAGTFDGISSNYSGAGFTGMKFKVTATPTEDEFNQWVSKVRQSNKVLDDATYDQLVKPSENNPVEYFSHVKPKMFEQIVHQYMHMNMSKKKDAGHMMKATDHSTHGEMSSDASSTLESATKE